MNLKRHCSWKRSPSFTIHSNRTSPELSYGCNIPVASGLHIFLTSVSPIPFTWLHRFLAQNLPALQKSYCNYLYCVLLSIDFYCRKISLYLVPEIPIPLKHALAQFGPWSQLGSLFLMANENPQQPSLSLSSH